MQTKKEMMEDLKAIRESREKRLAKETGEPIDTVRYCRCGMQLGLQNPGYTCGNCKFMNGDK